MPVLNQVADPWVIPEARTVSDEVIGGDLRLFKRGPQVLAARGDRLFLLRLRQ